MTINLDIYCKNQPTVDDLVKPLNLEPANPLEEYKTYRWTPKGVSTGIFICFKECIDDNIALVRIAGVEVPKELVQKFIRDNRRNPGQLCTLAVEPTGSSIREPLTPRPSCSERDAYLIRADSELYQFASRFPHLEDVDSWFKFPFGLVKFTRGLPTWEVSLEATVTASKNTLKSLTQLAEYFAISFDGIVYDSDNDKFGTPDSNLLYSKGMELFLAVTKDANAQGAKVTPTDF
jgi:hypothetical protein